jgi:hypothetical protein
MVQRQPPRFVPTLTEVVRGGAADPATIRAAQDELAHRILQRVDLTLERRLREAIASVVLEHTRQIAPALREQIEGVVAAAVAEAVAAELDPGRPPRRDR